MHIADGILSPAVCAGTALLAAGGLALSVVQLQRTLSVRTVPLTGMMAALVFAGQMVNFPLLGLPVSGHLLGGALAALVVGPWAGCVAIALVLLVQMALFADGGWMAYGANVLNMAVVGAWGGYAVAAQVRRLVPGRAGEIAGGVIAAWLTVLAGSTLFSLEFALSHPAGTYDLSTVFALMTTFHSAIGVGEALITGIVLNYVLLVAHRDDLLYSGLHAGSPPAMPRRIGRTLFAGVIVALAIAAFLAPFASDYSDGLEAVAERAHFGALSAPPKSLWLDDYRLPLPWAAETSSFWERASVSAAGVIGTLVVLAIALACGPLLARRTPLAGDGHVA